MGGNTAFYHCCYMKNVFGYRIVNAVVVEGIFGYVIEMPPREFT